MNDLTLVLTSCNRVDLLDKTLESIGSEVLDSLGHKIIIDDSGNDLVKDYFSKYDSSWQIILNEENIGQPRSVDKAYSFVTTPYIFHCEDDWFFKRGPYLEKSRSVLEAKDHLMQVTFRSDDPHPDSEEVYETKEGVQYRMKYPGWRNEWFGFTYNPSLFRTDAYLKFGKYAGKREQDLALRYYNIGYRTASLSDKYVHHIGGGRSTLSYKKL